MLYLYHVSTFAYHELKEQLTVGRTHGDLIYGGDGRMSGRHCQITVDSSAPTSAVIVEDQGSKNLTYVNRQQIGPNKKVRAKVHSFIEIGAQQFIVTDNKTMSLDTLNAILEGNLSKPVVKIDKGTSAGIQVSSDDPVRLREKALAAAEKELITFEQNTEIEIVRLEQTRERLVVSLKGKKAEMAKKIMALKMDLDEARRVKHEEEHKKMKIINLKKMGD